MLKLQELLGRLEFAPIGGAPPSHFTLLDGDREVTVAEVGQSHGPFYGVLPGRYRFRFANRGIPEVKLVIAAGRTTRVTPGETEAYPEGFRATARLPVQAMPGDTTIALTWTAPEGLEVVGYRVYRSGSKHPIHGQRPLTTPHYIDIGLSNGRAYTYLVRVVGPKGTEEPDVYESVTETPR